MRSQILSIIQSITPFDALEATHQAEAVAWIQSGAGLFRTEKPATPDPHLVSYFVVIDRAADKVLLVDHIKAGLWLPSGGHVDPNEHPHTTVVREAVEELNLEAKFLFEQPLLMTVTPTVGRIKQHTDVSLWYVLLADSSAEIIYDSAEFHAIQWFTPDEIPYANADPHFGRFMQKLTTTLTEAST